MTAKSDPIAAALNEATGVVTRGGAIEFHFGDRPKVLTSILDADKRGIPRTTIAGILQRKLREEGNATVVISDGMVKTWLDRNQT